MALTTNPVTRPVLLTTEFERDGVTFSRITDDSPHNVVHIWEGMLGEARLVLTEDRSDFAYGRVVWELFNSGAFHDEGGTVWAGRGKHEALDAVDALDYAADLAIRAALAD